jgi:hypothetical protein
MTEPDSLEDKIRDLKNWQSTAWKRVADSEVTTFERREIRNHIRVCDEELKRCLAMMSDRLKARAAVAAPHTRATPRLRLLATAN